MNNTMLYVLYSYLTNSINSLRVTWVYMLLFSDGGIFSNQCQHTFPSALLCRKVGAQLRILHRLSSYIDENSRMTIFRSFVLNNYCSLVWNFCEAAHTSKMERIQYRALICIYNDVSTSYEDLLARANLPTLELHRKREILVEDVFKYVSNISPYFMWDLFTK